MYFSYEKKYRIRVGLLLVKNFLSLLLAFFSSTERERGEGLIVRSVGVRRLDRLLILLAQGPWVLNSLNNTLGPKRNHAGSHVNDSVVSGFRLHIIFKGRKKKSSCCHSCSRSNFPSRYKSAADIKSAISLLHRSDSELKSEASKLLQDAVLFQG